MAELAGSVFTGGRRGKRLHARVEVALESRSEWPFEVFRKASESGDCAVVHADSDRTWAGGPSVAMGVAEG